MQKKCHRCGNFFTPIDGAIYCDKCSGTELPDSEPAETVNKYTIKTAREKTGLAKYRMAIELKIPATTYFTYEQKNYMPETILDKFAAFTGIPKDKIYCDIAKHSGGSRPHKKVGSKPAIVDNKKPAKLDNSKPLEKAKPVIKEKTQNMENTTKPDNTSYPQEIEQNEYRYLDAAWLDEIAKGLTAGAVKHPGETWHDIPATEHLARAFRHINLMRMGDKSDNHIINASMRLMMAFAVIKDKKVS